MEGTACANIRRREVRAGFRNDGELLGVPGVRVRVTSHPECAQEGRAGGGSQKTSGDRCTHWTSSEGRGQPQRGVSNREALPVAAVWKCGLRGFCGHVS